MSRFVHYAVTRKNRHHGEAIAAGFGARVVQSEACRLVPGAVHLIAGLQHGSLELLMQVRAAGEPYLFFDRAYFGGGPGSDRLRVVPNAYQHHWVENRPPDRLRALGVALKPWRKTGSHILLVPPATGPVKRLFGLADWHERTLVRLRDCTDRPVVPSVKPDPRPLAERLRGCWCVITPGSNVAVEAVCAGVPAIVAPWSAAFPVAGDLNALERIVECPPMPDREGWAAHLAYGQFSLEEIRAGQAAGIPTHKREKVVQDSQRTSAGADTRPEGG